MKIGIIREEKNPPDTRVALIPSHANVLKNNFSEVEVVAQHSPNRCFSDEEYMQQSIQVANKVDDCDVLIGVKEVPIQNLIPNKTYFFFSHTIKKQSYNRRLLQAVVEKNIRLIDYECITDNKGNRVIAFGRFAGIVGAHNGLMAYGNRTGLFKFPRVHSFKNLNELYEFYKSIQLPAIKIVVTGGGRVAMGSLEVLEQLKIKRVNKNEFVNNQFSEAVYVQLDSEDLYFRKDKTKAPISDFYKHPEAYECHFQPYYKVADIMINAIFWSPKAPIFFTKENMKQPDFSIKTIADISCDIDGSVPATTRATTISDPVMGYNPITEKEDAPYQDHVIDIMSIDNLPNELPRDASEAFSEKMLHIVIPELLKSNSEMIERATIAKNGNLTAKYEYLRNYLEEKE
jgi:alanine dehydrogenase